MFKQRLTNADYDEVKTLVDLAMNASNKQKAKHYIACLERKRFKFEGYAGIVFGELISSVKSKSKYAYTDLAKLKGLIEE